MRRDVKMGETSAPAAPAAKRRVYNLSESIISAISVGTVFILFGLVYVLAFPANLFDRIVTFFGSLALRGIPGTGINLPAPINPGAHVVLYTAVFQFFIGLLLLQFLVLALRIVWKSPIRRTAETVGSLVFWAGSVFLANAFLNAHTTVNTWFAFWSGILIMIGLSLIARALVLLAKR
jgi:hypothetical protein